ncbi:MAG: mechanosensitive ion channel family protein [Bacteroidales bacterium]
MENDLIEVDPGPVGELIENWLSIAGLPEEYAILLRTVAIVVLIIFAAWLSNLVTRRLLLVYISRWIKRSKSMWDDILLEHKLLDRLANYAPALIIYYAVPAALSNYPDIVRPVQVMISLTMIMLAILVIDALLNALHEIYQTFPISRDVNIKGYIQIVKILTYFVGIILFLSVVMEKSPIVFLTGLGAIAAVLLLVFKDTILGFVASIQLSANDMVRIGDWIEMPGHNADGTVLEITLNTVKVRNWDQTITTIPTYALIAESFYNWRGMEQSGGRRIKRSINIDMKSVQFCTTEMLEKFSKIRVLESYILKKEEELKKYNESNNIDDSITVNKRRQTNIGVFRKYIELYLRNRPDIHPEMTFLVRHLQPSPEGIPIEIYVFSKEQSWPVYEGVQADIFDHILSVVPEFGLRVFQNPTGDDFRRLLN